MIFLMSASVGFMAHWLFLFVTFNILDRTAPLPPFRAVFVGMSATVLFSVLVRSSLHPDDILIQIGGVMLNLVLFMFALGIFKLIEGAEELVGLRSIREKLGR